MTVSQFTDFFQQLLICKTPEKKAGRHQPCRQSAEHFPILFHSLFSLHFVLLSEIFFYSKYSFIWRSVYSAIFAPSSHA